ncbi:hypothetical protein IAR55_003504 [Kwoniella newhampshirensis]|uniref:Uncharacterized protein n=1 Tax=Kwoniella newhampshirensis TaxID=1651941 RepID=A0AAW0YZJ7_9TREE
MSGKDDHNSNYVWTPKSEVQIADFVKQFRPSLITDDLAPWIWVSNKDDLENLESNSEAAALGEAMKLLEGLEKRLKDIEEDDTIPTRAKKGVKSKKALRDEAHEEIRAGLKAISIEYKWTYGKWLLFPSHEFVDGTWSTLAQSVAKGPLKAAGVESAKVAPTPSSADEGEARPHLICLYLPDIYDIDTVRKVLEVLLTSHGLEPSSVKSDLYTVAGIDSNHPTKLRSTIWRPAEVIPGGVEAIKALKAQYKPTRKVFSKDGRPAEPVIIEDTSEDEKVSKAVKRKEKPDFPPPSSKVVNHGDGEGKEKKDAEEKVPQRPSAKEGRVPVKRFKSAAMKFRENDIFAGSDDDISD